MQSQQIQPANPTMRNIGPNLAQRIPAATLLTGALPPLIAIPVDQHWHL